MLRKLTIFVLLFLFSQEETEGISYHKRMIISDALPVQFWLEGCDTYNEADNYGVHGKCWYQPFACSDEIKVQFRGNPLTSYDLLILDDNGSTLQIIAFSVLSSTEFFENYPFSGWETLGGAGSAWTEGDNPSVTIPLIGTSEGLSEDISGLKIGTYQFSYDITGNKNLASASITFRKENQILDTVSVSIESGSNTGTSSIVLTDEPDEIRVVVSNLSNSSLTVTLNSFELTSEDLFFTSIVPNDYNICDQKIRLKIRSSSSPEEDIARTDLLDIKPTHSDTRLVAYSNDRNFAGLIYENLSPDEIFYIRIPCRFFHQQMPQADQAIELTSSVLTTSSQKKKQKLLEVLHCPYYFHNKIIEVIQHHTLSIDNVYWKKEEAYDISIGDKRWPLKTATCWLTDKGSVVRNVI